MKKLLLQYGLLSEDHYYSKVSEYYRSGNLKKAKELFKQMPKRNRIDMTKRCLFGWHTITQGEQLFYFNLLTGLTT